MSDIGEIKCSATICSERKQSTPFVICSGFCKNYFHAKCAGLTGSIADKIADAGIGLYWYCEFCRKTSPSALAFKISNISQSISSLGARLAGIYNDFKVLVSEFKSLDSFGSPQVSDSPMKPPPPLH